MAQFGEILAELRKDHNMSQKELAKIIYVSTGTISNYETGTHFPDVEKLIALADHFHVTTDYLLGRCRQDCSQDIFDTLIAEGKTIGDLIQEVRTLPPEIPKPRPGMNVCLPRGGRTTTGRNRQKPKLLKSANVDTENARDNDSPWRFCHYCRSSKSIYF